MLLRTVVLLLLLCVSTGMCASLVSFQIQQKEREKDSQDLTEESAVVADAVVTAVEAAVKEGEAAAVDQASDKPVVDQASDKPVVDQASDKPVVDQASDKPVVDQASDTPVVDQASDTPVVDQASDKPVVDQASDTPAVDQASDTPAEQVPENLLEETLAVDNPDADTHKVNEAGDPGEDGDRSAGDTPAVEAVGVIQELPSSAEEDNEIKPVQTKQSTHKPSVKQNNSTWGLHSIRNSFQAAHGYFDSLVELVGGHDGVCQYRCRYGGTPQPRPGYQVQEPNGCSSSLVGMKVNAALDLGIPAMTECCNQIDVCYDSCGTSKYDCDLEFRSCLHDICSHLKKSLGFVSQVQACESVADVLYNTVWTLGCRPYMNSQRAACVCDGEERDEL